MFEEIQSKFYESFVKTIIDRKNFLNLKHEEILPTPARVSKIINIKRDTHHPHLIGREEYTYLYYLFLCKDHDSFMNNAVVDTKPSEHIKKCGSNYDKMLWGHIDWDKMFQDVITELSKSNNSEKLGKIFEDTLDDYVPYAVIKSDKLDKKYARIYYSPDEIKEKRNNAIQWVHLRHGSKLFKQIFYKNFSGQTFTEFDKNFSDFVSDYLEEKKATDHSFGKQAYNFHQSISRIAVHWQSLVEVLYGDVPEKKSELQTLLEEYIKYGREQMKELEKYQKKFDELHIDTN